MPAASSRREQSKTGVLGRHPGLRGVVHWRRREALHGVDMWSSEENKGNCHCDGEGGLWVQSWSGSEFTFAFFPFSPTVTTGFLFSSSIASAALIGFLRCGFLSTQVFAHREDGFLHMGKEREAGHIPVIQARGRPRSKEELRWSEGSIS